MSVCTIVRMLCAEGHGVTLHPTRHARRQFNELGIPIGPPFHEATDVGCDVLFFYANDFVYHIRSSRKTWPRYLRQANRRIMCLNFTIAQAADAWFRKHWHKVLFLNESKRSEYPADVPSAVLAPAVCLTPYLAVKPDYSRLNIIRHSKGAKHSDDEVEVTAEVYRKVPSADFWFMGVPPGILRKFPQPQTRFHYFREFQIEPAEFLRLGSLFWYRLAPHMRDQGPRVIVEAMAAGVPCLVDDRDGAKDRVTDETGWRCRTNEEYVAVVKSIAADLSVLKEKGEAARRRAVKQFDPRFWIDEITGSVSASSHRR